MRLIQIKPIYSILQRKSICFRTINEQQIQRLSSKKILDDSDETTRKVKKEISDLPDKQIYPEYSQTIKGVVYDKKPFKYHCIEGKAYVWCSCGRSHKQVCLVNIYNKILILILY